MARAIQAKDVALPGDLLAEMQAPAVRPTWGSTWWPIFLLAVSLAFVIPEVVALCTNSANTLSDFSWYELGITGRINHHTVYWWASLGAWWLFVGVISAHIWFRTPG